MSMKSMLERNYRLLPPQSDLMTVAQASVWASSHTGRNVTASNISH